MIVLDKLIEWIIEKGWEEVTINDIQQFKSEETEKERKRLITEICIYKDLLYKLDYTDGSFGNKKTLEKFIDEDMPEFLNGNISTPRNTAEVEIFLENLKKDKL